MNIQTVALPSALSVGDSPLAAEMSGRRDPMDAMAGCLEVNFGREFWIVLRLLLKKKKMMMIDDDDDDDDD